MPTIEEARAWYQRADAVHDFDHIMRVYGMAERLGKELHADMEILLAAALLHDAVGGAPNSSTRGQHHLMSAEFARDVLSKEGWPEERIAAVQHCIRAHRYRSDGEAPQTVEARILFDSDKLDVLGAIGVARTVAYAAINNQPFYAEPSEKFLASGQKEPGELHSAYHEYLFKLRKIKDVLFTETARQLAEARDQYLREYFLQLAAELASKR